MNLSEIASETGFSENNVYTRLEKYNIEKFDIPKKIIVEKYIEEEESIHRVSEDLDVSVTTVLNKMDEYDIDTRNPGFSGEDHPFYGKTMGEERRKSQSKKMKELWEKSPERFEGTFESPSKEVREKMSVSAKKRVERQGIVTSYNSEACSVIDEFGEENGYNFQHAENGDEFQIGRYFVDGYDRDENIVVEYMEKHHIYTEEEDKDRRRFIINELGCSFVEIWYDGSIEKFN